MASTVKPSVVRAWWLAFLGVFVPLALPPLALLVARTPLPGLLGAIVWLWWDLFAPEIAGLTPEKTLLLAAVEYSAMAALFACTCAWGVSLAHKGEL